MCGIAGLIYRDASRPLQREKLQAMAHAIAHRGPDGEGFYQSPGVGLAHRRLAIIDLAGGRQPIGNEDGTIQVVFNGEIYNYRELRQRLEAQGHRFQTQSDTEVLVHLYEEVGEKLVLELRGMFAFAIWDSKRRRLFLARDRLGIKPLYYAIDPEKFLFCSELKGILAHGEMPREIDLVALEDYFAYGMISGAKTIFRGMFKLSPGTTLTLDVPAWLPEGPESYWVPCFVSDPDPTQTNWTYEVRAKIEESVDRHLIADVPVGSFLSGGIDSSIITALASQRVSEPLQTFSVGFRESRFNELPYARQVAEQYHTRHVEEIVSADAVQLLDQLCWFYDEPFADSSAIPTLLLAKLTAQHVKVALSGDGGDEAFGGYARYAHDLKEDALRQCLPDWFRARVFGPLGSNWPKADWLPRMFRAKTLLTNLSLSPAAAYANTLAICRLPFREQLFSSAARVQLRTRNDERQLARAHYEYSFNYGLGDPLAGMISTDLCTFLPDDYLVKVDRASMAYGLEVRPPLLDHELMELAMRVPSYLKIHQGETKWILKEACHDLLPSGLRTRPKQGFEIPVDEWLRGPLREPFEAWVLDPQSVVANLLDLNTIRRAFADHCSGRRRLGAVLWSLMVFSRWANIFLTGNTPVAPAGVVPVKSASSNS